MLRFEFVFATVVHTLFAFVAVPAHDTQVGMVGYAGREITPLVGLYAVVPTFTWVTVPVQVVNAVELKALGPKAWYVPSQEPHVAHATHVGVQVLALKQDAVYPLGFKHPYASVATNCPLVVPSAVPTIGIQPSAVPVFFVAEVPNAVPLPLQLAQATHEIVMFPDKACPLTFVVCGT